MELTSYDSELGFIIFCRFPFRTSAGPPPIAVFAPRKLGDEAVEMVNTDPVEIPEAFPVNAGPIDRIIVSGSIFVSPVSRISRTRAL